MQIYAENWALQTLFRIILNNMTIVSERSTACGIFNGVSLTMRIAVG